MPYYKRFLYVAECIHPRNVIPELFFRHIWRHFRAPCQPVFFADSFNMLNKIKKRTFFLKLFLWILSGIYRTKKRMTGKPSSQFVNQEESHPLHLRRPLPHKHQFPLMLLLPACKSLAFLLQVAAPIRMILSRYLYRLPCS